MSDPTIAVAVSGGVDSLVSGYLLRQRYRNVFGIHFVTGYEASPVDTRQLEKQLNFPVTVVDLSGPFEKRVVRYFIDSYLEGKTPNPCVICNKTIKFTALFEKAKKMGANVLATGHYATVINPLSFPGKDIKRSCLEKGTDPLKDQSYFLSLLSSEQLERLIFPLAGQTKTEVKQFARDKGLFPLHPGESQDICFIHDGDFARFILEKENIRPEPGNIVNLDGRIVGRHSGLHQFTIGQRRGINCPAAEPYYVKHINIRTNTLTVCFKKDLASRSAELCQINWNAEPRDTISGITTKIRYSHMGGNSTLSLTGNCGCLEFDEPQNAITPGQTAAFYKGSRVLGGGIIV